MAALCSMLALALIGCDGEKGEAGQDGRDGQAGVQGPAGRDGVDGKDGAQGPQGEPGPQGPPGPAGESTGNASGSRLKARYASTPDGARIFLGWRDSELGFDCEFQTAEDGKQRSLPREGHVWFSDDECTELISSNVKVQYISTPEDDERNNVYKLVVDSFESSFFYLEDGKCTRFGEETGLVASVSKIEASKLVELIVE